MTLEVKSTKHNALSIGLKNLQAMLANKSMDSFIVDTLEALMQMEREEHLSTLKASGVMHDKGNGSYARSFKSLSRNAMSINIPRTRFGEFKPAVLEFLKYSQEQINELVLELYSKGLSARDVSDVLENFFGTKMSFAQVSSLAEKFHELRKSWLEAPLQEAYKAIYCDALYVTVRRGASYAKEPVHIIYGVRSDDKRELLSLDVHPTESASSWAENFALLVKRGVKQVGIVIADGIKGLEDEVHTYFPGALFQKCVVHKMRNVLKHARPSDKAELSLDLKHVFDNFESTSNLETALAKLDDFSAKWGGKYPKILGCFDDTKEYYFTYIKVPAAIRRMIYTTNSIESLNKKLRKATKNKQSFEKTDRLLDYLFIVIKDFEADNWMRYPINAFSQWSARHN